MKRGLFQHDPGNHPPPLARILFQWGKSSLAWWQLDFPFEDVPPDAARTEVRFIGAFLVLSALAVPALVAWQLRVNGGRVASAGFVAICVLFGVLGLFGVRVVQAARRRSSRSKPRPRISRLNGRLT